ncbi:MAG: Crp/Fnr family transcriptional regulator [Spirochaetes bacterium]|nr:Crp/Fnr family transcriptional regulator [Spirochaetota bacterium]
MHDFSGFSELFIDAAKHTGVCLQEKSIKRGGLIFRQGQRLEELLLINLGLAAIRFRHPNGQENLIALNGPGETLGDLEFFLEDKAALCGVIAVEHSTAFSVDYAGLQRMLAAVPDLFMVLGRRMARRLETATQRLSSSIIYPLEYNLLKAIMVNLQLQKNGTMAGSTESETLLVQRRDLCDYLGHTERHISRGLKELAARNIVHNDHGKIILLDEAAARRRMAELEI